MVRQKIIKIENRKYIIARDTLFKNYLSVWQGEFDLAKPAKRVYTYNNAYDFIARVEGRINKDDSFRKWKEVYYNIGGK